MRDLNCVTSQIMAKLGFIRKPIPIENRGKAPRVDLIDSFSKYFYKF